MKQLLVLFLMLLLGACVPQSSTRNSSERPATAQPAQSDPQASYAMALYENNDFINAADLLEQLSYRQPPEGWHWQLLAADAYLHLGNTEKALTLISPLADKQLGIDDSLLLSLIQASLYLHGFDPESALLALNITPDIQAERTLQHRYYLLLSEAYRLSGNQLESANALQQLDRLLLDDPDMRLENQLSIIRVLSSLSDTALQMLQPSPPGELGGWMELARLIKLHGQSIETMTPLIAGWQSQFPAHPAMPELLGGYYRNLEAQYRQASHVAVLLPESGPYQSAAKAIRRGISAAWFASSPDTRPVLRFYDSSSAENIWPLYMEATQRGADFVIGPLQKEAVSQLLNAGELPVPVLALNQVNEAVTPPANFYQYALSPEDEATQVAEKAWLDGKRHPVVLSPAGNWGERISLAFATRWQQLGGEVAERQTYDSSKSDFAQPIKALLDIDQSEQRHASLQRILGQSLKFEPRRREDSDFIFVVAKADKARELRPQLQFHQALDMPIYTTSHAWRGYRDTDADRDIEGILFPDIPWLLVDEGEQPLSLTTLKKSLPLERSGLLRLLAMGIDSYLLTSQLGRLQNSPAESLDGKTGMLYMDMMQNVHRQLVWARVTNNAPKVIGFAPRIPLRPTLQESSPIETGPDEPAGIDARQPVSQEAQVTPL